MTLLFEPDAPFAENIRFAIGGEVRVVDSVPLLNRSLEEDPGELLVVIGPDVDLTAALALTAELRVHRQHVGVVLLRRRVDVAVLSQALRAGVREVVNPEDLSALGDACRRSLDISRGVLGASSPHEQQVDGKIVTVFAAKGGCGKTTIATNLAVALANRGARRVCLIDLDLAFGDVAIAMQLVPSRTIIDALTMQGSIDEMGIRSLLTPHSPGLDTILAPLEPGEADKIPVGVVTELLRVCKTMFDYVVVDSPPAFTEHVLSAFDLSDSYVLLATLDIPALKNLRLTLDMLDLLGYPRESWQVVLNRSDSKVGLSVEDVERTLKVPIAIQIPSSRAVSASINQGVPLVQDQPNHPVSAAIRQLAEQRIQVAAVSGAAKRSRESHDGDRRSFSRFRRGSRT